MTEAVNDERLAIRQQYWDLLAISFTVVAGAMPKPEADRLMRALVFVEPI